MVLWSGGALQETTDDVVVTSDSIVPKCKRQHGQTFISMSSFKPHCSATTRSSVCRTPSLFGVVVVSLTLAMLLCLLFGWQKFSLIWAFKWPFLSQLAKYEMYSRHSCVADSFCDVAVFRCFWKKINVDKVEGYCRS